MTKSHERFSAARRKTINERLEINYYFLRKEKNCWHFSIIAEKEPLLFSFALT